MLNILTTMRRTLPLVLCLAALGPLSACRRIEDGTSPALKSNGAALSGKGRTGEQLYRQYCSLCHGPTAEGYAADNAPSLVSRTFLETATPEFLRDSIVRGRPGTAMAAYGMSLGGPLNDLELTALVSWLTREAPPRVALPPDDLSGDRTRGQAIYEQNCQTCHGTANQRGNAVHLANPVLLGTARPAFLRYAVVNGRPGTPMKPWAGKLEPSQIDDVIAYVRSMAVPAQPMATPVPVAKEVPPWGPIILNPEGGTPTFHLRDDRFAPIKEVNQALTDKKRIVIVDARAPSDWLSLHIPGSLSLPYYDLGPLDKLPTDGTWIIAYCACPHHASGAVVDALRARGIKTSAVLDEGVFAWQQAGYPIVAAPGTSMPPAPPPLPPAGTAMPAPAPPAPTGAAMPAPAPPAPTGAIVPAPAYPAPAGAAVPAPAHPAPTGAAAPPRPPALKY